MDELVIRPLTLEDYLIYDHWEQQLHRLHVQARPDLFQDLDHPVPREQFRKELEDSHEIRLMAEWIGQPAGLCSFSLREAPASPLLRDQKSAYVVDLFVDPAFRHKGIAKALLAEGIRLSREFGAQFLSLTVWPFNESAMGLYQALGFRVQRCLLERPL